MSLNFRKRPSKILEDNISNKPHQRIKATEKIEAANTKTDIASNMNSPKSNCGHIIELFADQAAFTISINIFFKLI